MPLLQPRFSEEEMLPIIVKDIAENLRAWILFAIVSAAASLLCTGQMHSQIASGFTQAITLGSGLIFAHGVVFAERRRRHLVFLRGLPISDSAIVGGKFISVLLLTYSLAAVPYLTGLFFSIQSPPSLSVLGLSLSTLYTSLVLGLYICFRHPALPFIPLYGSTLVILWSDAELSQLQSLGTDTAAVLSLAASILVYRSAVFVFKMKELDF